MKLLILILTEKIKVVRDSGKYVDGIYQGALAPILFTTLGSVQQPTPKDLQSLPEGERSGDVRKIFCLKRLYTSDDISGRIADKVVYNGMAFKVINDGDWQAYGYTEGLIARIQDGN